MAGKATVILNREELRVGFTIETEMSGGNFQQAFGSFE